MRFNEKGGVDSYIATTICLVILMLFVVLSLATMKVMNDYTTLQRALDLSIDGIKTHGGYTQETHTYIRSLIDSRNIKPDKVNIMVRHNGAPASASAIKYGDGNVNVIFTYRYSIEFMGKVYTFPIQTASNAMSQFVFNATPQAEEQRYVVMTQDGISLKDEYPTARQDPVLVKAAKDAQQGGTGGETPGGGYESNNGAVDNDLLWQ